MVLDQGEPIVITGAAGFIGSYLLGLLNREGYDQAILVDGFSKLEKAANLEGKRYSQKIDRSEFAELLLHDELTVSGIFHLGARTDTTEMDYEVHRILNLEYSKLVWSFCSRKKIPMVYASSAATYGDGTLGYSDRHDLPEQLKPLNPYGVSKNEFDKWALRQSEQPPFWAGLKFFNVYGPNEYHKGRMASVIFHAYNQLMDSGAIKLFRSHHPDYADGGQMRDFVYVSDIASMCLWLMEHKPASGLYNAGTGKARTYKDLATAIFDSLGMEPNIVYVDTPLDIRDKYQYFTEADMGKLQAAGYQQPFYSIEQGVADYLPYLQDGRKYF